MLEENFPCNVVSVNIAREMGKKWGGGGAYFGVFEKVGCENRCKNDGFLGGECCPWELVGRVGDVGLGGCGDAGTGDVGRGEVGNARGDGAGALGDTGEAGAAGLGDVGDIGRVDGGVLGVCCWTGKGS